MAALWITIPVLKILIYTTPETLRCKRFPEECYIDEVGEDVTCYWEFKNLPKRIAKSDQQQIRLYVATKGRIRGYFVINEIGHFKTMSSCLYFDPESWIDVINNKTIKPFQGFKYLEEE